MIAVRLIKKVLVLVNNKSPIAGGNPFVPKTKRLLVEM